jgi:polyribonucleotide nucleotidyltransferase
VCSQYDVQIKIPERSNKEQQHVNGDSEPADVNNNNNIIRISGKKDNCDAAAKALNELVPVSEDVEVPFEYHRFIIGAKGAEVRKMMDAHEVNIKVPSSEQQSNTIVITGPKANIVEAKKDLEHRVKKLDEEKADRELRNFEVRLEVNPELHPKIIGTRGAVIQKLRADYNVNIQLPRKGAPEEHVITITGYESDAHKARDAIKKIVDDYESMTREEVRIDPRVHSKIIGRKGAGIRKLQQDYKVEIKLPREGEAEPDLVVIMGGAEDVLDCKDELLNLVEEFMQDMADKEWMEDYLKPARDDAGAGGRGHGHKGASKGFEVKGAP